MTTPAPQCIRCQGLGHRMGWKTRCLRPRVIETWEPLTCEECKGTGEKPEGQTWDSVWMKVSP